MPRPHRLFQAAGPAYASQHQFADCEFAKIFGRFKKTTAMVGFYSDKSTTESHISNCWQLT